MDLGEQPPDELRHLHHEYGGQSYLVSYWQRVWHDRRYVVVAWHDIGRIVKEELPRIYSEGPASTFAHAPPSARVNVVDEEGRIIFGPPLRSGEFTVGVPFPTTLYNWRLQVSPKAAEELTSRVQNRASLELVMLLLSCVVIVAGRRHDRSLAAEQERRVSALKSEFVANVSHELKTPLALVRMFGEMLQSGRVASEEKRQEYLDIIVRESERLSNLIENVLDFAKVERGREAYDFAEGDVGEAVAKAANVYRYRAEREAVELVVDVAPQPAARDASTSAPSSSRSSTSSTTRSSTPPTASVITVRATRGARDHRRPRHRPGPRRAGRGPRAHLRALRPRGRATGPARARPRQRDRPGPREAHRREPRRPRVGRERPVRAADATATAGATFVFTIPARGGRARAASSGELFTREIEGEDASCAEARHRARQTGALTVVQAVPLA